MSSALWMRLRDVDWEARGVTPSRGKKLGHLLADLSSRKELRAMRASQKLWMELSKGAAESLVVAPFLREIREVSSTSVRAEIEELLEKISE